MTFMLNVCLLLLVSGFSAMYKISYVVLAFEYHSVSDVRNQVMYYCRCSQRVMFASVAATTFVISEQKKNVFSAGIVAFQS